jgi:hypothetical protein
MLAAFVMIILGALIIWVIDQHKKILLRIWLRLGVNLFQYTFFHNDDESGDIYGLTFTNDEHWDEKCLKDLNDHMRNKEAE